MGNGGQHGGFGQGKLGGRFVKINTSRRLNTIGQVAVEIGVQIPFQNLLFGVNIGHPLGQEQFLNFAPVVINVHILADNPPLFFDEVVFN